MPSQEYWTQRAEESARRMYDKADNTYGQLKAIYKKASDDMTKELNAFYTKYGVNQQSPVFETLADGTEVIKGTTVKRVVPIYEARKYKRLNSLEKQLNVIMSDMAKGQNAYMTTNLRLLAQESYNRYFFDVFQGYGVGYQFDLLDPKLVTQLIRNPVNGQDFSTRIWKNKDLLANRLQQELNNGLIQGISTQEMTKRFKEKVSPNFRGKEGTGYKAAERLMRTEITNTYNQATLAGYNASGIVDDYEYLATLDNRTSTICQDLDGNVFKITEATAGLNYPPMHPNCFDKETEVFTDQGWKLFADLNKEELFLSINPDDITKYEWVKAKDYISYNYKGEMISFKNNHFDMMVTPNHRMLLSYVGKNSPGKWRFVEADKVPKWNNIIYSGLDHNAKEVKTHVESLTREVVEYDDKVYCVSLEKFETLLTRRNGFVAWSGNCRSTTVAKFDDEEFERIARNPDTGETYRVPSNMNYQEWDSIYNKKTMTLDEWKKAEQIKAGPKAVLNRYGQPIEFNLGSIKEKFQKRIKDTITKLSNEYNTSLISVTTGNMQSHAAGEVGMDFAMRLSSKKEAVATHEFAHSLAMKEADKLGLSDNSDFFKELTKLRTAYRKESSKDRSMMISIYADDSKAISEFMAEGFAQAKTYGTDAYEFNGFGENPKYAFEILKIIDKYFKK